MASQLRFERNYELIIDGLVIKPPIRISFQGYKSINGGLNRLNVNIFNLKESNRSKLVKDAEQNKRINLELKVGYTTAIETIFKGNVHVGKNERQGPDIVSRLECLDSGYAFHNSSVALAVKGDYVRDVVATMPGVTIGKLSETPVVPRTRILVGNQFTLLRDSIADDSEFYIDNEQVFIIKENDVTSPFIAEVSSKTGLMNTPTRENKKVFFDTLMNPSIKVGSRCQLESTTAKYLDGIYKVYVINYNGDNYGQDWKQSVECLGTQNLRVI